MAENPAEKLVGKILKAIPGIFKDQVSLGRVCAAYVLMPYRTVGQALKLLEEGPYKTTPAMLTSALYAVEEENPEFTPQELPTKPPEMVKMAAEVNKILDKVREFYDTQPPTA